MLQGIRALVVDDDEMSLEMLATILGSQGVLCTVATNGREALDVLETNANTDILLLDLQMPVMDGFEVLAHCKGNPYLSDIPIIVMAANRDEKLNALKLGADDFLAKPYDLEELELRITRLIRSRRSAQSATKAKIEFLSVASHELRTPLHQITGLASILDSMSPGEEQKEFVQQLKHSAENLIGIIRDILNYVQLDHGSARASVEPFSLRATVQGALDSLMNNQGKDRSRIALDIPEGISDALNGPSFYIYKVFSILIDNAIKFSPVGEVRIAIREESFGVSESRFSCSVADHGSGISLELNDKIFEPFVQADSSETRRFGGIGLGLAIAKRMVELMGGTISVTNNESGGSTFNFSFHCNLQEAVVAEK
jgi:signal transduction histidine kinase